MTGIFEQVITRLCGHYVYSAILAAALGIGLYVICDGLTFVERLKAVTGNSGEMNKYIVAALSVGNKAKALFRIKPFNCTFMHNSTSNKYYIRYKQKNSYLRRKPSK